METTATQNRLYGLVAQFDTPEELVEAAKAARDAGFRRMDSYSPFPINELEEALDLWDWKLPWIIFLGGVTGAMAGFTLQVFTATSILEPILQNLPIKDVTIRNIPYPMNVGGRPNLSWPSFIPVTFETTILFAAGAAVVGMLLLNGFPRPHHPIFNAKDFDRATLDKFFLCIEATDPKFDMEETHRFLTSLKPESVSEVEL